MTTLNEFYVDNVLYSEGWRKFIDVLLKDWQDFILWATVLLAANMSFLAIFNSTDAIIAESRAVTCSLVSTLCSTVSIIIGLLHVRKHRAKARTHAADGSIYLNEAEHPTLGMRPLAIVYCLPYAFLMWAMVTFIAAILLFASQSGLDSTLTSLIGTIAIGLGAILVWAISYFWKDELQLKDDFRGMHAALQPLSPMKVIRLVGTIAPRVRAANTPIVRGWIKLFAARRRRGEAQGEGV